MQDTVDQIVPRLLLGDGIVTTLEQIDDPHVARQLTDCLWADIPESDTAADANTSDRATTPRNITITDHDVATTPVENLERDEVINRLIVVGVLEEPDAPTYDIDYDVAADAYRIGRRDERNTDG